MYAVLPYAVAQGAVELPWALGQAIVYSCITYFMIYFEMSAAKFFYYLLFSYLTLVYFTFYGVAQTSLSTCSLGKHASAAISSAQVPNQFSNDLLAEHCTMAVIACIPACSPTCSLLHAAEAS